FHFRYNTLHRLFMDARWWVEQRAIFLKRSLQNRNNRRGVRHRCFAQKNFTHSNWSRIEICSTRHSQVQIVIRRIILSLAAQSRPPPLVYCASAPPSLESSYALLFKSTHPLIIIACSRDFVLRLRVECAYLCRTCCRTARPDISRLLAAAHKLQAQSGNV